jgi:hypothetical protein
VTLTETDVKDLCMRERLEALVNGRDREHRLLDLKPSHLATFWQRVFRREMLVSCLCGWAAFVETTRFKPLDVYRNHVESEASRPVRTAPRSEALVRDAERNLRFLLQGSYRSEGDATAAVYLLNRIDSDYYKDLLARPPRIAPFVLWPQDDDDDE